MTESKRIQMKISRDTVLALEETKKKIFGSSTIPVPNGYIVDEAYKNIEHMVDDIEWLLLNSEDIPGVTNTKDTETSGVQTTLNLNSRTISGIELIRENIRKENKTMRIHRAFILKLILFAYLKSN